MTLDLDRSDATAVRQAVTAGTVTVAAVTGHLLERAERLEPIAHAYAHLDAAGASRRAAELDDDGSALRDAPLFGLPIGVKDLIRTADLPTRAGASRPPELGEDALVVTALRQAGVVILGKHETHEYGLGVDVPPTRAPWAPDRYAGGSSVGGGVSVASGTALVAIGTDGAGSVRKPAAANGLVGFKPSAGLVPLAGVIPAPASTDAVGWITRSARDAALVLAAFAPRPDVPHDVPHEPRLAGRRLGVPSTLVRELAPEVEASFAAVLALLRGAGVEIVRVDLPEIEAAGEIFAAVVAAEAAPWHAARLGAHAAEYSAAAIAAVHGMALTDPSSAPAAYRARAALRSAMPRLFGEHRLDALLTPTMPVPPGPLLGHDPADALAEYTRFTMPANLTGQPAVSLPVPAVGDRPVDGMPQVAADGTALGIQLVGLVERDWELVLLAEGVERALGTGFVARDGRAS